MAEIPKALVKDLLSTGYFYEGLKNYSESKEIDLAFYSKNYLLPYLIRISESYEGTWHSSKSHILNVAVERLSGAGDAELAESIFGLKTAVAEEIDSSEKAILSGREELDKSELISYRHKSESAQSLSKLLVSIIRMFKLAEDSTKRDRKSRESAGGAASKNEG